jgi:hypothetical protein
MPFMAATNIGCLQQNKLGLMALRGILGVEEKTSVLKERQISAHDEPGGFVS